MDAPALDPEFDSSDGLEDDDDWDRSQFARKPTHGKRRAATILARQAEDRSISKRNARKLGFIFPRLANVWDCPLDDCDIPFKARSNADVRNHLKRGHTMSEEASLALVLLSKREMTNMTNREKDGSRPSHK